MDIEGMKAYAEFAREAGNETAAQVWEQRIANAEQATRPRSYYRHGDNIGIN